MNRYTAIGPIKSAALGALLTVVLLPGCGPSPGSTATDTAPATPCPPTFGIPPAVSINAVMVALIDHSAHAIWDLGREGAGPETEKDWLEVEHHATQLAAGGSWIATGGTGEADAGWVNQLPWRTNALAMTDGAIEALTAAQQRDLPGVLRAGDLIIESCEGCHLEFKPDLPTEGIVHPHHYDD